MYFGLACLGVFAFGIYVSYVVEKEKRDPVFAEKMDRFREKWSKFDPFSNFIRNLVWWVVAAMFVWFVYLGQGG
ncbi:MAG: hypothetical protein K0Q87_86 [Neobacillus sp.]|nr:hypothetical protein [Neobacillus sp.]